jgi:uracil-DNA glycosylase
MERVSIKEKLKIDYKELFSEGWTELLNPLLSSIYMFNLIVFIGELYKIKPNLVEGKHLIYPYKNRLFENFRSCDVNNLKIVILGSEPFSNYKATGVPFANTESVHGSTESETILIERCIRKTVYNNDTQYEFDETLKNWCNQGIFLLDVSSTSEEGVKNAHGKYWANFTREVIKIISNEKDNLIFIVWGSDAEYFTKYISSSNNHHILRFNHPSKSLNSDWNCPNFNQANLILKKITNGKEMINW